MDINANVVPFIGGEEEKMQAGDAKDPSARTPRVILSRWTAKRAGGTAPRARRGWAHRDHLCRVLGQAQ